MALGWMPRSGSSMIGHSSMLRSTQDCSHNAQGINRAIRDKMCWKARFSSMLLKVSIVEPSSFLFSVTIPSIPGTINSIHSRIWSVKLLLDSSSASTEAIFVPYLSRKVASVVALSDFSPVTGRYGIRLIFVKKMIEFRFAKQHQRGHVLRVAGKRSG